MTAALCVVLLSIAACGGDEDDPVATTEAGHDRGRTLAPSEAAALRRLGDADGHAAHHEPDHGGHAVFGPVEEAPLAPADQARFDAEWRAAVDAASDLMTPEAAAAAGYAQASSPSAGTGAHWVRWSLVDAPFDPAAPSMLLFDQQEGRPRRLAGFSYWVRSEGAPPEGFAGPNDRWHRHRGMCFVDGWLDREDVSAHDCPDDVWVSGESLWMLHAWVVPDRPNRWGRFAPTNPDLCPPRASVPDVTSCEPLKT